MRVGVRELRDGLSRHLRRVRDGHTVVVTEHGNVIAKIVPAAVPTRLEQLMAEGKVVPAQRRKEASPEPLRSDALVSDLIRDQRR